MPLDKSDAPANRSAASTTTTTTTTPASDAHPATKSEVNKQVGELMDTGAGAPPGLRAAAEALPERNPIEKAHKEAQLANDAQTEAKAKAKVVELSPDSPETPSGHALLKTAGISDDVKRAEEYGRIKTAVRHGYVPADEKDLK
jgi:hypothetical protein